MASSEAGSMPCYQITPSAFSASVFHPLLPLSLPLTLSVYSFLLRWDSRRARQRNDRDTFLSMIISNTGFIPMWRYSFSVLHKTAAISGSLARLRKRIIPTENVRDVSVSRLILQNSRRPRNLASLFFPLTIKVSLDIRLTAVSERRRDIPTIGSRHDVLGNAYAFESRAARRINILSSARPTRGVD